jgi:hypothetical protein
MLIVILKLLIYEDEKDDEDDFQTKTADCFRNPPSRISQKNQIPFAVMYFTRSTTRLL